jgi:hypothetical protein
VSNPVAPPPPPGGAYPPPANQGFGAAPTPGYPQPGYPQPGYPQQGQAGYPQGQAGFPQGQPPPGYPQQGFGDAPGAPPAKKKSAAGKLLLRIGGAVLVAIVIFGLKSFFFSATDKAKDAAVGDCIASSKQVATDKDETDASAKVVDCGSADAAFTVVGRVNGETDIKSKSCDHFFKENEQFFVYAADNGASGYLLCLRPKA